MTILFLQVGVTVHTPGDPDKAVRIATAAALAESARKLAQEAASFIDTGDEVGNDSNTIWKWSR